LFPFGALLLHLVLLRVLVLEPIVLQAVLVIVELEAHS